MSKIVMRVEFSIDDVRMAEEQDNIENGIDFWKTGIMSMDNCMVQMFDDDGNEVLDQENQHEVITEIFKYLQPEEKAE